jgi:hypothetical protein
MTILLACEFGVGLRHTARLLKLAQHYLETGHNVAFCHYDTRILKFLLKDTPAGLSLLATPAQGCSLKVKPLGSYGDILSCLGCDDPDLLTLHLASWQAVLNQVKPSLIICENAPVLSMAAQSVAPLIGMGDGYSILPFAKDKLPLLRPDVHPKVRPDILLARMNEALKRRSLPALETFGNIWQGYPLFISHLPELDMYLPYRKEAVHAPFYPLEDTADPMETPSFFAYLFADYPNVDSILISLVQNNMQGVVYMPDASHKIIDYLTPKNITVHRTLEKPLMDYLAGKNFVFHHGGMDLTQAAFAKGIPQIFFPTGMNGLFLANTLKSRGCGDFINAHKMELAQLTQAIKTFVYQSNFRHWSQMESLQVKEKKLETAFELILKSAGELQERQAA